MADEKVEKGITENKDSEVKKRKCQRGGANESG
jgi:hypothetical protein